MFQATPTLIIGIGGTGLKVATHVKKDLLEANQNELPQCMDILVLDTESEVRYTAGGWGAERSQQHATGPVKIDVGEYIALTGNVRDRGVKIKNEQLRAEANPALLRSLPLRHLSSWFQARYYLDEANVDASVWNLDVGAGRYRQFGRIAFFNRVKDVRDKVKSSLDSISRMGANRLYVHITGSLAGGTGAALFIDTAHLITQIAHDVGFAQEPVVLGHFVLPEGFRGTKAVNLTDSGVKSEFDARAYAALRELTRLQGPVISRTGGYPVIYAPSGKGEMRARLQNKLYSTVYLYDGIRENNALNSYPLEKGLAPAIADAITAYVDDKSGGAFCAHSVNYQAFYPAYNIPAGTVTYGSVGTYTIELPIYHITEGWAHRLAQQVLDTLLVPDMESVDRNTGVPADLLADQPGGRNLDPQKEAKTWLKEATTVLVSQLAEWGQKAQQGQVIQRQTKDAILALNAEAWLQWLAPSDPRFQTHVKDAQTELEGSLSNEESYKYYVDHNQSGDTSEQKSSNMQQEVDNKLRLMVGNIEDVWQRSGGDFRRALVRLGNHHVEEFEVGLIKKLQSHLNGGEVGSAQEKKGGKLGFVQALLALLEEVLAKSAEVLAEAEKESRSKRRPQFNAIDMERNDLANQMQRPGLFGSLFGRKLKEYREKSNELAQFHKADIARQVAYDLAERLHQAVSRLQDEVELWVTILATATAKNGGAYALVKQGQQQVETDRNESKSKSRWVIDDDEPDDAYIRDKYNRYVQGKLDEILEKVEWRVGRLDDRQLRIDFVLGGERPWSRQAGRSGHERVGLRNVNELLMLCREAFEPAWHDMSVTAYLKQNYYEDQNRVSQLAQRVYQSSGYLLDLDDNNPTMRTTFVRVYQEGMDTQTSQFLGALRREVAKQFGETTDAAERAEVAGEDYLSTTGQDSRDPFKLTFVLFGDLLQPSQIAGYKEARDDYHAFSGAGNQWRMLQVLPAETNALEIEKDLDKDSQRRRELNDEVVTVLEEIGLFQLAMRCLAYGETDYFWGKGSERGLLLHRHTPLEDNQAGYSYWRLTVRAEGREAADGRIYDNSGRLARPLHYQLSEMTAEPDLLQAFIQLVSVGKDKKSGDPVDWNRVESTLEQAVAQHRRKWAERPGLGWRLLPGKDRRLEAELLDKATRVIRLNAFIASLDEALAEHRWAWDKAETDPPASIRNQRGLVNAIRRHVDLHTALRGVAQREMENLNKRLQEVGARTGEAPTEMLSLNSEIGVDVTEAQPDNGWLCSNGHQNQADDLFCADCGERRPEPQQAQEQPKSVEIPTAVPTAASATQQKLNLLEQNLEAGLMSQEEYDAKKAALLGKTGPDAATQKKLDLLKQSLEAGLMSQEEHDAKKATLLANEEPADPETQQKLNLLEQNLEAGLMSQKEYDAKVAQIRNQ